MNTIAVPIEDLRCPITKQFFADPVVAGDGITYEKTLIVSWLKSNQTSPTTGRQIDSTVLPNTKTFCLVKKLLEDHPELKEEQYQPDYSFTNLRDELMQEMEIGKFDKLLMCDEYILSDHEFSRLLFTKCPEQIIKHCIDKCINLEQESTDRWVNGFRFVHYVCRFRMNQTTRLNILKYLVEKGVNLECETPNKERPIHSACQYAEKETINYLIEQGVDLEASMSNGSRPFHLLCKRHIPELEMIKKFIDLGVNLDTPEINNEYIFDDAVYNRGPIFVGPDEYGCPFQNKGIVDKLNNKIELLFRHPYMILATNIIAIGTWSVLVPYSFYTMVKRLKNS